MATITIPTDTIDNYAGAETAPVLRWILNKNIIASDGDVLPKSSIEEGEFYKEVVCAAALGVITYPQHTIDSTEDATPPDGTLTLAAFTETGSAGELIQIFFKKLRVAASPTTQTLEDILIANQEAVSPAPDDAYTEAQTDALLAGKIDGDGVDKVTVGIAEPASPAVGDLWIDTDN